MRWRCRRTPSFIVTSSRSRLRLDDVHHRQLRELLGGGPEVAFMAFDREHFWLHDAVETARQLRDLVQPLVRGRLPVDP